MFWPDHSCREYCLYLGSIGGIDGQSYDLGVYINSKDGYVSHAIIFGPDHGDYYSGNVHSMSDSLVTGINKSVYLEYLNVVGGKYGEEMKQEWLTAAHKYLKESYHAEKC